MVMLGALLVAYFFATSRLHSHEYTQMISLNQWNFEGRGASGVSLGATLVVFVDRSTRHFVFEEMIRT